MAEIKEFKPKPATPVVDEDMLKSAQALVERIKSGTLVGMAVVMIERGSLNALHSWGGDCPRNCILGGMTLLQNRILGNVQEDWALPFDAEGPQARDMDGSKALDPNSTTTVREATMDDLPEGDA